MSAAEPPEKRDSTLSLAAFEVALARLEFPEHKALPVSATLAFDPMATAGWLRTFQSRQLGARALAEAYTAQFGAISRDGINRLYFAEKVTHYWFSRLHLDSVLMAQLVQWLPALTALLVAYPELATNPDHPLRRLMALVEQQSLGWYQGLQRMGQPWLDRLEAVGRFLKSDESLDPSAQEEQLRNVQGLLERENGRVGVLEARVREAAVGADRAWHCRQLVHHRLNRWFAQWRLPQPVIHFLAGPWRDSMQLLLLAEGVESPQWAQQIKLAEALIWAMQDHASAQAKERLYKLAARLVDEIAPGLMCFKHRAEEAEPWLSALQELLLSRLRGQSLACEAAALLPLEERFQPDTRPCSDQGFGLVDKWFVQPATGVRQKCIAYLPHQHQLVWVNCLGMKLGTQDWSQARDELAHQQLQPLAQDTTLSQALEHVLARFMGIDQLQRRQRKLAQERENARVRQQDLERAHARLKAEQEAEQLRRVREANLRHQSALEAPASRPEPAETLSGPTPVQEPPAGWEPSAAQGEPPEVPEAQKSLLDAIDRMKLGAWIELIDAEEVRRCKLAMRLNASGKLVFVDRLGLRVGDFKREDLLKRLEDGSARILDEGADFDQRLSRVVGLMRSKGKE